MENLKSNERYLVRRKNNIDDSLIEIVILETSTHALKIYFFFRNIDRINWILKKDFFKNYEIIDKLTPLAPLTELPKFPESRTIVEK